MRWKANEPEFEEERVVTRFLFLPKKLPVRYSPSFIKEWRWLEFAKIRQEAIATWKLFPFRDIRWEN